MKREELEILEKVLKLLERHSYSKENELIAQYKSLCEKLRAQNEKGKQHYRKNQEYHRNYTKEWKKEHPEQAKKHQTDYLEKKRMRKMRPKER